MTRALHFSIAPLELYTMSIPLNLSYKYQFDGLVLTSFCLLETVDSFFEGFDPIDNCKSDTVSRDPVALCLEEEPRIQIRARNNREVATPPRKNRQSKWLESQFRLPIIDVLV